MSSIATLRWASTLGTLLRAMLAGGVVVSSQTPVQAPLQPSITLRPNNASVQSKSYVS